MKIVQKLDSCLTDFNLPTYYEVFSNFRLFAFKSIVTRIVFLQDPSFHASILWCVGDHEAVIKDCLGELQQILDGLISDNFTDFAFNADQLFCKCGNKLYNFPIR